MKKNRMMRLASGLMVAVLLTTSMISGTFAKYVTSASGTDTARVAKFGVAITANGSTFAKEYATDDEDVKGTIANSVVSTENVVAPGTDGSMVSMALAGTPEVAVRVSYTGAFDISDNWTVDSGAFYCPLEITDNTTTIKGKNCASAAEFEAAVNAAINDYSKDYAAGTDLSGVAGDSLEVSWAWAFEGNDDAKDTFLGNQAAAGNPATVTLNVTTTVTQID